MSTFVESLKNNKKRTIICGLIGVLLATIIIWFFTTVYEPFTEPVSDILVYTPPDADFVLFSRDFPTLIRGLDDREFMRNVDQNRNLQRWLNSPKVVKTEIIPSLRQAYAKLREIDSMLPFDLEVLGDLSGQEVVLAGYEAKSEAEAATFVAVVQPESAMAQIAVNALLDPFLCDLFVTDKLEGGTVEHFNWGARIDLNTESGPMSIGVARVDAAVFLGTNVDAVAAMVRSIAVSGVPYFPDGRFEPRWVWEGGDTSGINLMLGRRMFEERVRIKEDWLEKMWGSDLAQVMDDALPFFRGRDIYFQMDVDASTRLKTAIAVDPQNPQDLFSSMDELNTVQIQNQLDRIIKILPHYVFGYSLLGVEPSQLLAFVLNRRSLISADEQELLYELLSRMERFQRFRQTADKTPDLTLPLIDEVNSLFHSDVGIILFKKEREAKMEHSQPGVAIVLSVKDRRRVESFIEDLDTAADQPFERFDREHFSFWQVTRDNFLDDPENNKPAFAMVDDYLIVTNWVRVFLDMQEVKSNAKPSMPSRDLLEYNLRDLPIGSRGFLFLDPKQLYAHMDQAKEGWIADRSQVNAFEKLALRRRAQDKWIRLGLAPESQESWVDQEYEKQLSLLQAERSEARIRAEIDQNLDYFRDAFSYLFLAVGRREREFRLDLRLATQENY